MNDDILQEAVSWAKSAADIQDMVDWYYDSVGVHEGVPVEGSIYESIHEALNEYVRCARELSGLLVGRSNYTKDHHVN